MLSRKPTQDRIYDKQEVRLIYQQMFDSYSGNIKDATRKTVEVLLKIHPGYGKRTLIDHVAEYHEPWFVLPNDEEFKREFETIGKQGMKAKYMLRPRGAVNRYKQIIKERQITSLSSIAHTMLAPNSDSGTNFSTNCDDHSSPLEIDELTDSACPKSEGIHPLELMAPIFENGNYTEPEEF